METRKRSLNIHKVMRTAAIGAVITAGITLGLSTTDEPVTVTNHEVRATALQPLDTTKFELDIAKKKLDETQRLLDEQLTKDISASFDKDFKSASFVVSAYSPYDDLNGINSEGDPSVTSIGANTGPGTFAVDPSVIPYGSKVLLMYPDGTIERGVAEDTGGAIKGNRIDVFRWTFKNAMEYGMKDVVAIWY